MAYPKESKPEGALFLIWLIFFGSGDYVIRFFRGDLTPFMFGLPESQVVDIAVVAAALIMLVVKVVKYRPTKPATGAV